MSDHTGVFQRDADGRIERVSCNAEGCKWAYWVGSGFENTEESHSHSIKDHADQFEPGRAPNIDVEYKVVAYCSVCPNGSGSRITIVGRDGTRAPDSLQCEHCGTGWDVDGKNGTRDPRAAQA